MYPRLGIGGRCHHHHDATVLLVIVQRDVAELALAARIVRIRQHHALFRAGRIERGAPCRTLHLAVAGAGADLLAAHLHPLVDAVRTVLVDAARHDRPSRGGGGGGDGCGRFLRYGRWFFVRVVRKRGKKRRCKLRGEFDIRDEFVRNRQYRRNRPKPLKTVRNHPKPTVFLVLVKIVRNRRDRRNRLESSGTVEIVWNHSKPLESFEIVCNRPEPKESFGSVGIISNRVNRSNCLRSSGSNRNFPEPPGTIWNCLEPWKLFVLFGIIRNHPQPWVSSEIEGIVWNRPEPFRVPDGREPSESSGIIWKFWMVPSRNV